MQTIGTDTNGDPIPGIPEPGDLIRINFRATPDMDANWQTAYLVALTIPGLWWTPVDDVAGACWAPWSEIGAIEGPEA